LGSGHIGGQNQPTVEAARKKNRNREYLYRGIATRAISACKALVMWASIQTFFLAAPSNKWFGAASDAG